MKRSWLLAATAGVVFSNPLPEEMGATAADPPSGIGTGVTIAIPPPGGMARGCYGNWNGPAFGIAAVPIKVQRNSDGSDSSQNGDQPIPKFTLAPSASSLPNNPAEFDMPAVTAKPALRLIKGDARVAAADPDSDVTVTSYSTRTRTKTVTLKSAGSASSASVAVPAAPPAVVPAPVAPAPVMPAPVMPVAAASPTVVNIAGLKSIKAAQLSQIADGQVQAAPSPSVIALKPAPTQAPGTGAGSGEASSPFAPLPEGAPRISQIGDGQIQAPTAAVAPIAASGLAVASSKESKGGKGKAGSPAAPEPAVAPIDALYTSADLPVDGLVASGDMATDALFTSTEEPAGTEADAELLGSMPAEGLVKRQNRGGRTGGYGCKNKDGSTLEMTLKNGVLLDNKGRTGYIADNRQYQFDAPPQAGAQVTAGWGICDDGFLTLGPSKVFYQCLSGSFYNIYDRNIAAQCNPINLIALENRNC